MKKIATSGLILFLITLLGSELRGMAVVKTVDQPNQSSSSWVDIYRQFTLSRQLKIEKAKLVLAFVLRNKTTGRDRQRLYKFAVVKPMKDVTEVGAEGYEESWVGNGCWDSDEDDIRVGQYFFQMMEEFFHLVRLPWGNFCDFSRRMTEHLANVDLNQGDVSYDLNIHDASSFRQQEAVDVDSLKTPQEIIEKLSKALPSTVLGISAEASEAEAKKAFRKLSLKFHPDKWSGQEEIAAEAFKII